MLAYGIAPSDEVTMDINVEPVMSFCGPIVNVRRVEPGTQVSYGGVYMTERSTNIGVMQTGFADGFPRPWYKNGHISYKGEIYDIAGRVCMDQFMVDFGDMEPRLGDEVLIFGKKDDDHISLESIAKNIDTTGEKETNPRTAKIVLFVFGVGPLLAMCVFLFSNGFFNTR